MLVYLIDARILELFKMLVLCVLLWLSFVLTIRFNLFIFLTGPNHHSNVRIYNNSLYIV